MRHLGDLGSPGVYLGYEPCALGRWVLVRQLRRGAASRCRPLQLDNCGN